jgi:four helix bundle protein
MIHKNLTVYKRSVEFVTTIYNLTKVFPKDEMYGLTSQIRRSAISIPSNISEGTARKSDKELIRFLYISLGSAAELDTQLEIARNLNFIPQEKYNEANHELAELAKMINGLISYQRKKETRN